MTKKEIYGFAVFYMQTILKIKKSLSGVRYFRDAMKDIMEFAIQYENDQKEIFKNIGIEEEKEPTKEQNKKLDEELKKLGDEEVKVKLPKKKEFYEKLEEFDIKIDDRQFDLIDNLLK